MEPCVSQKPQKATEDEKNKRKRKKKSKQTITRAITPIRLIEANPGKLDVLDQLVEVYLALTGRYVTLFCTVVEPNKYAEPIFETSLSERGHRVAIQQAAGIAHSWRTNRENARPAYLEFLADYSHPNANPDALGSTPAPQRK